MKYKIVAESSARNYKQVICVCDTEHWAVEITKALSQIGWKFDEKSKFEPITFNINSQSREDLTTTTVDDFIGK